MNVPTELDEYRIVRPIGRGGMGDVYLAHDTLLDRPVAIKFIRISKESPGGREQFAVEARSAARLQHPNVCVIHRIGEWSGEPYIVSEYIKGTSLAALTLPLPEAEVIEIGIGLARGLAAAHRQGILHRDIKPANVLRSETGEIKLVDFGIAELAPETDRPVDAKGAHLRLVAEGDAGTSNVVPNEEGETRVHTWRDRSGSRLRIDTLSMLGLATRRVIGTPDYIAPELWRGQPACRQSDVYALGALLYELCVGETPFASWPVEELPHVTQVEECSLVIADPSVEPRFAAIIDRCLRRDIDQRFSSAEEVREALEDLAPAPIHRMIPEGNPYRGLRSFEAEHGALFFGRNREMRAIVERMRSDSLVVVAGDSGVGKSSLCRAGVLPCVQLGAIGAGRQWTMVSLIPGRHPLAAFWQVLEPIIGNVVTASESPDFSVGIRLLQVLDPGRGLVLFIDQLEELVTLADPDQAVLFCKRIDELLLGSLPVRILATARADFFSRLAILPGIGDRLGRATYVLRNLDTEGIREAITGPIATKGFHYESEEIIATLVNSTKDAEEGLPLLQFALAELWELRDAGRKVIPLSALSSIGGVSGALARHADAVFEHMLPRNRTMAKRILLALVTSQGTRARRPASELGGEQAERRFVLEALVQARLLVVRESDTGPVYELAHEALLTGWHTLRGWLMSSEIHRAALERLTIAAAEWDRLGRSPELLWRAKQLEEIAEVADSTLSARDAVFLDASRKASRRKRRRLQALAIVIPLLVGMVIALPIVRGSYEVSQKIARLLGETRTTIAHAHELQKHYETAKKQALALFHASDREAAEARWKEVLELGRNVGRVFRDATQKLDNALLMDSQHVETRILLAAVLFERALLSERQKNTDETEELVKRFRLFDDSGALWRRWTAPASVKITTSPASTGLVVERYVQARDGKLTPTKIASLGPDATALSLPAGSYRFSFTLPGHVMVRYPVVLSRGESFAANVFLPKTTDVPEGFIYVPPGRSTFGGGANEDLRTWYKAVPEHSIYTKGFFIRRYETTFDEWISYLEDIPTEESASRIPSSGMTAAFGQVGLARAKNGWQYHLQTSHQKYTSDSSGRIRYPGRAKRVVQFWRRFPVGSVSFLDVTKYIGYLQQKHPTLKARMCAEREWERAARGADDRIYPHGNELAPDDINYYQTYGTEVGNFGPDEIGSHPASRSPFDVEDMSGNVWEWVRGIDGSPVIRGGGYYQSAHTDSATNREVMNDWVTETSMGLRLCADVPWKQTGDGITSVKP